MIVTKQDREPYLGSVQVISTNAPFVTAITYQIDDAMANNNQLADFNEQFLLDVDFQNLGSVTANGVIATLSTNAPNVSIIDDIENLNVVASSTTINAMAAYELMIADGVQDQSQCFLGCAEGFIASEAFPGLCQVDEGLSSSSYQGQQVTCKPSLVVHYVAIRP